MAASFGRFGEALNESSLAKSNRLTGNRLAAGNNGGCETIAVRVFEFELVRGLFQLAGIFFTPTASAGFFFSRSSPLHEFYYCHFLFFFFLFFFFLLFFGGGGLRQDILLSHSP